MEIPRLPGRRESIPQARRAPLRAARMIFKPIPLSSCLPTASMQGGVTSPTSVKRVMVFCGQRSVSARYIGMQLQNMVMLKNAPLEMRVRRMRPGKRVMAAMPFRKAP